ncbi:hypothetical protein ONE63_000677 [Megalurothrips usitatus]|uniref:Uncharacterized protein n=1 Tax=Megalurothrips usitatus TaxID=439358 RepID=A0AAV7XZ76_9NEOP|nr:hypothetical protein ONE63_000677 [Megalurothrips usitatus]
MFATKVLVGALLLGVAKAQFLQVASDPAIALQPPPLHQGGFATFSAQPVAQTFIQQVRPSVTPSVSQAPALAPLPVLRQQQQQQPQQVLAHHAVVRNSEDEARLPAELQRSQNFYKDPRIAEGLAKSSWFTPGEEQVLDREAEKIPREQVFKLLKNAGLVRRR